jgi:putative membrane protein
MGGALLLLQGAAVLAWLLGGYGRRGLLAALLVLGLAWGVEQIGVTTGFPFGRYYYTEALQPQLLGGVPLAIASAWLMVAIGAWQLAATDNGRRTMDDGRRINELVVGGRWSVVGALWAAVKAATLVLLLDLQIETVATQINRYWVWVDGGLYYGVPLSNFVGWWLVGLGMALVVDRALPRHALRSARYALRFLPAYLYLLSTLMFAVVNLARGYTVAGLFGVMVLCLAALAIAPIRSRATALPSAERAEAAD